MARYAKVDVRIWDDERVRRLSAIQPSGQGLWIRLLVSRHRTSIPGLLCVGEAALAEEFGWTLKGFREGFQEVLRERLAKADWNARLVWIPKAIKYNPPENPNVIKGWEVPWNETPECALKDEAYRTLKEYVKGLSKGFQEAFEKGCPNRLANQEQDPEQEQEQEQEQEDPPLPPVGGKRVRRVSTASESFEKFYAAYPRHTARGAAEKAWPGDEHLPAILAALEWQAPEFRTRPYDKVPHPATWLNGERWKDEKPTQPSFQAPSRQYGAPQLILQTLGKLDD